MNDQDGGGLNPGPVFTILLTLALWFVFIAGLALSFGWCG